MNTFNKISLVAAVAAASLILISGAPAQAQTGKMKNNGTAASNSNNSKATNFRVSPQSVPGAVEPIMSRAASLLLAAEARQKSAPGEAKESYKAAADALRELLTSNRLAPAGRAASVPSVSSTQAADDIRTLRAAAKSSTGNRMEMLNKSAALYATGTKEYFTGQLREALFDTNVSAGPVVLRGKGIGSGGRPYASADKQGGVIQNPPSVYNQNGDGTNGGGPVVGGPLTVPGTTVVAPVLGNGGVIVNPGTVQAPVVPVTPTTPAAPVAPAPQTPAPPAPATPPANP